MSAYTNPLVFVDVVLLFGAVEHQVFSIFFYVTQGCHFHGIFLFISHICSICSMITKFAPFFQSNISYFAPFLIYLFSFFAPFLNSSRVMVLI